MQTKWGNLARSTLWSLCQSTRERRRNKLVKQAICWRLQDVQLEKSWWCDSLGWWQSNMEESLPFGICDSDWCPVLEKKRQLDNICMFLDRPQAASRAYPLAAVAHPQTRCHRPHRRPAWLTCPAHSYCLCRLLDHKSRLVLDFACYYSRHHSLAAPRAVCCRNSGNCCPENK